MANKSIDLLKPEEQSSAKRKRAFFLKTGTIFLIVFYCLLVVAIFSFGLVTQRESKIISDKTKQEQTRLGQLEDIETLQFLLKQRLSSLSKAVKTERITPRDGLNLLESLVPEGLALEDIQWEKEGQVNLSGTASNALALSDFLESLKQATDKQKITSSVLVSATRQKEGTYNFSLEVLIKE